MHFDSLRITQPSGKQVYSFAATADEILQVASIARIGRDESGQLLGYQRPEVSNHIAEIRRYVEGENAVIPNTIVIAFDNRVHFKVVEPSNGSSSLSQYGKLIIPDSGEHNRPGFVVDGQQRLAAIASCKHERFPVFVTAMVAASIEEQREQFVLVNRTKPLPQGLVFELLPELEGVLPSTLARQRVAAAITSQLNLRENSSLYGRIKTPTCPTGVIKDNSMRRLVINSLSDGALFDIAYGTENSLLDSAINLVSIFWDGVKATYPEATELPPDRSRLTHGVGIAALGFVMDYLYLTRSSNQNWNTEYVIDSLKPLRENCAWTSGTWDFGNSMTRKWNDLQNIDRDIRMLTDYFRRLLTPSLLTA